MTRSELYALVWQEPMTKLAKRFRLSDVGLRKICAKHGIPTPPLGYWAKLAHGKKVTQPPLPPIRSGQSERIDLTPAATEKLSDEAAQELRHALEREAHAGTKITVPNERPRKLHPVAEEAEKALREAREDHYGFRNFSPTGIRRCISPKPRSVEPFVSLIPSQRKLAPVAAKSLHTAAR